MEKLLCLILISCAFPSDVVSRRRGHGAKHDDGKIVGGYDTTITDFPHQALVSVLQGSKWYQCGGSIISDKYILTAAHCLTGAIMVIVRVGSTNANSGGSQHMSFSFKIHPKYNSANYDYDVGLVRVLRNINLNGESSKAILLADKDTSIAPNTTVTVSGWGTTSENGQLSETLMAVDVPTVSTEECSESYGSITPRMFCAGVPEGGKDSCQGDSGGPAITSSGPIQLGIVSFGIGCARPGFPGVYTSIPSVRQWIKENSGV